MNLQIWNKKNLFVAQPALEIRSRYGAAIIYNIHGNLPVSFIYIRLIRLSCVLCFLWNYDELLTCWYLLNRDNRESTTNFTLYSIHFFVCVSITWKLMIITSWSCFSLLLAVAAALLAALHFGWLNSSTSTKREFLSHYRARYIQIALLFLTSSFFLIPILWNSK